MLPQLNSLVHASGIPCQRIQQTDFKNSLYLFKELYVTLIKYSFKLNFILFLNTFEKKQFLILCVIITIISSIILLSSTRIAFAFWMTPTCSLQILQLLFST